MKITRNTGSVYYTVEYRGKEFQVVAMLSSGDWNFEMRRGGKSLTPSLQLIQVSGLYPTEKELETAILNLFFNNQHLNQLFEE